MRVSISIHMFLMACQAMKGMYLQSRKSAENKGKCDTAIIRKKKCHISEYRNTEQAP